MVTKKIAKISICRWYTSNKWREAIRYSSIIEVKKLMEPGLFSEQGKTPTSIKSNNLQWMCEHGGIYKYNDIMSFLSAMIDYLALQCMFFGA